MRGRTLAEGRNRGTENVSALRGVRESKKSGKDDYHYQDNYGAIMTDKQHEANNAAQADFNAKIASGRSQVASATSNLNTAEATEYAKLVEQGGTAQATLDKSYNSAMNEIYSYELGDRPDSSDIPTWESWSSDTTMTNTVRVDNDQTYVMTKESWNTFVSDIHAYNAANDADVSMFSTDTGIRIETNGYGAEWHNKLGIAEQELKNAFNNKVSVANAGVASAQAQWDTAAAALSESKDAAGVSYQTQYDSIQSQLNTAHSEVEGQVLIARGKLESATLSLDATVTERNNMLQAIRDQYSTRISSMREGATGVSISGSNANEGIRNG